MTRTGSTRSWILTAGMLAAIVALVLALRGFAEAMTSATLALAAMLLLAGGALIAIFLRRAGWGSALSKRRGWRWLDPGAVLYLATGLASFVVLFLLTDAKGLPALVLQVGALLTIGVPVVSAWVLEPREVEA